MQSILLLSQSIMLHCSTNIFSQICNMKSIDYNTLKDRKTTKGAIFLVYEKSAFSGEPTIVSKVGEISDIHVSNVRKILAGSTNSNLDTFEKCVEALGKRIIIIEVPDTTELNLFLSKYGYKKNKFWKLPSNKNNNNLSDFLLKFLGIEEKTQPYSEEAFQLISVLDAAAAKKGEDNKELLDKMKRFRKEIALWATK